MSKLLLWTGALIFGVQVAAAAPEEEPSQSAKDTEVTAAPSSAVATLPSDIPSLPGPRELTTKYLVNSKNVHVFQDLLLAPVASWLKEGKTVIRLVRNLDFPWKLSEKWEAASATESSRATLDAKWNLKVNEEDLPVLGYPLGTLADVEHEKDPAKKAAKILWNAQYATNVAREIFYDGELTWLGAQSVYRRAAVAYFRRFFPVSHSETVAAVVPAPPPVPGATSTTLAPVVESAEKAPPAFSGMGDLLFQEVLQLTSPPVVFGYADVSWRYRGIQDDEFWIHSPVIGKNRKLPATNRADPIIAGSLGLDDFFGWSGKIQSVNARVVDDKVILLPFPAVNTYRIEHEKLAPTVSDPSGSGAQIPQAGSDNFEEVPTVRGHHKRLDATSVTVLWNHETGEYAQVALWTPTTVSFVPRHVWILELQPKDPFLLEGKQILVVDQESFLPFYRIVFGQGGDYLKTVLAGWCLASTDNGSERFPFLGFLLAVESDSSRAMSFTTQFVRSLPPENSKLTAQYQRHLFIQNYKEERKGQKPEGEKSGAGPEVPAVDETPTTETAPRAASPKSPAVEENVDSESTHDDETTSAPTSSASTQTDAAPAPQQNGLPKARTTPRAPDEDPGF